MRVTVDDVTIDETGWVSVTFSDGLVWSDTQSGIIQMASSVVNIDTLRCLLVARNAANLQAMKGMTVEYKQDVLHNVVVIQ